MTHYGVNLLNARQLHNETSAVLDEVSKGKAFQIVRNGKVVAMKDTQVTLHEEGTRREWKLPYAAVEPPKGTGQPAPAATPKPSPVAASRDDFRGGEKVSFDDKYLQPQVGTVIRINQRTATVDTGNGHSWRVPFHLLRRVLDI